MKNRLKESKILFITGFCIEMERRKQKEKKKEDFNGISKKEKDLG